MDIISSTNFRNIIIKDRYFLLIDNKGSRKLCTINMKKTKLSKKPIDLTFFEKRHLNSFWDIEEQHPSLYKEISQKEFFNEGLLEDEEIEYGNEKIVRQSNKEIYSDGNAQKLSEDEIKEMKERGMKSDELIKTIIESNTSMEKRTIFSQEKIIKKKEKKHKHLVWVANPGLFNILETFFIGDIKMINYMRIDSISAMLVNTNFNDRSKILLFEEANNVLTSAYAMRASKYNQIWSLFSEKIQTKNLNIFNLRRKEKYAITHANIKLFTDNAAFYYNLFSRQYENYFDNLVLSVKNDASLIQLVLDLFQFLKCCGQLIVFAKELEALILVDKILIERKLGIDTRICETVLREYQVLPLRTHPMMNNKGYSGYVLTSIKIPQ